MRGSDKIGFDTEFDPQIHDSKHDEIIIWLFSELADFNSQLVKSLEKASGFEFKKEEKRSGPWIEYPLKSRDRIPKTIGFADLVHYFSSEVRKTNVNGEDFYDSDSICFYFEVKTKVNLGDTVRQINYYISNSNEFNSYRSDKLNYKWIVVSPDDRYRQLLKSQDIGFIKYPG